MRNAFVETENVRRFQAGLGEVERRVAREKCLVVVDGEPGLGKTTTLTWWVAQSETIYLRACREWSPRWFLEDLLGAFLVKPKQSFKERYQQCSEALLDRQSKLALRKKTFAVVIDEADHISRNSRIMETIRDFSDTADIPFVLVGMGRIRDNLTAFPQIWSRVAQYVRFEKASFDDVRAFCDTLCEVPVADDFVSFVHRATEGYSREILGAIATIERFGKRNGNGPGNPVGLADMAGRILFNDRQGKAVAVPEAL